MHCGYRRINGHNGFPSEIFQRCAEMLTTFPLVRILARLAQPVNLNI